MVRALEFPEGIRAFEVQSVDRKFWLEVLEAAPKKEQGESAGDLADTREADGESARPVQMDGVKFVQNAEGRTELRAEQTSQRRPLLFVHGACHSASCWVNVMLYFSTHVKVPCFALSLREHDKFCGTRSAPTDAETQKCQSGWVSHSLDELASDVEAVVTYITRTRRMLMPVLIAHSFGGSVTLRYCVHAQNEHSIPLIVLISSVKPSISWLFRTALRLAVLLGWRTVLRIIMHGCLFPDAITFSRLLLAGLGCPDDHAEEDKTKDVARRAAIEAIWAHEVRDGVFCPKALADAIRFGFGVKHGKELLPPIYALWACDDELVDELAIAEMNAFLGIGGADEAGRTSASTFRRAIRNADITSHDSMLHEKWLCLAQLLLTLTAETLNSY
mmetsp:Transcript_15503/g.41643  ORF Transcript_15503/g.41643 Transcript_15503/m.41643 type:complete len:389 (-) Transcript_15503:107-1273(-)|eukprot:CAMPEP_0185834138 /NCGR_PEP_ID=MMETSP1353-20130828/4494_1 /TAXON_ID=1077150 /ORGANISM="Erythrolobus australicus, Strain CCMP3124" /LENGTH=388 /DNA_ID=CAMNT_0028532515 /DNA_START=68 /DNA_END=1234 /DNA_ORIENTATION=-